MTLLRTTPSGVMVTVRTILLAAMVAAVTGAAVAAELSGRVVDTADGRPLPAASAHLSGARVTVLADADGRFTFAGLTAGPDTLVAGLIGYERARIPVTIPGTVEVRLVPHPVVLDEVLTRTLRPDELPPHERTSASVTVVTREEITERTATVEDVLDDQVGVDVRSLGGVGARQEISIRGSTTEQVTVYVDGVPLTAAGSGLSGLGFVPAGQVSQVEVYRGASPGAYGAGGIGGVVSIETVRPGDGAGVDASVSYGSFGTTHQRLQLDYGAGGQRFRLTAGHNASENDFRFYDDRGTTIDNSDDGWETRRNSDYKATSVLARWDGDLGGGHSLMGKISVGGTGRGVSGLGRRPALFARLNTETRLGQFRYRAGEAVEVQSWMARETLRFRDPMDEAGRRGRQDTTDEISVFGVSAAFHRMIGRVLADLTVEASHETFDAHDVYDTALTPPSGRNSLGIGAETEIMLAGGRFWIVPRLHLTTVDDRITSTSIMLAQAVSDSTFSVKRSVAVAALGIRYSPISALTLRMNAGRYARLPEFGELFGDTGDVVGNTDLTEERSRNYDAGFHWQPGDGPVEADLTVFHRFAEDLIQQRSYGDYLIAENIGRAEVNGIETWASGSVAGELLEGRIACAWQDARNRSDETVFRRERYYGKKLPYHPDWVVSVSLGWRVHERVTARWSTDYESACYKGPSNLVEEQLPSRTIHNLALKATTSGRLGVELEAANLTDNHAPDRWGYPKPGRAFYLTLTWNAVFDEK